MTITAGMVSAAREAAESLMVDTCTIKRATGSSEDANGVATTTYAAPYYTGRCKVQARDINESTPEAGDRLATVIRMRVDVPMTVTGVATGDLVTITASAYDLDLVGSVFRVTAPFHGSIKTARRLPVEEAVT